MKVEIIFWERKRKRTTTNKNPTQNTNRGDVCLDLCHNDSNDKDSSSGVDPQRNTSRDETSFLFSLLLLFVAFFIITTDLNFNLNLITITNVFSFGWRSSSENESCLFISGISARFLQLSASQQQKD